MDIFEADDNSTPLTAEEKDGLKLKWITLHSELNEAEARNIAQAQIWLMSNKNKDIFSDTFLRELHKKMFGDVWKWAGVYRTSERNIGVAPYQIPIKLMQLFDDVKFWIENKTYSNREIAVRLHHKLVQIHPFPNGNGRVSRLMADLVLEKLEGTKLYWGNTNLVNVSEVRSSYIAALRKADGGDYADLMEFTSFPYNLQ
ncbi:MAG: mobile mystery protein B [Spirochaetales bacterium]|nr:mobile mystery protein B [Spirochaetales bacterium]